VSVVSGGTTVESVVSSDVVAGSIANVSLSKDEESSGCRSITAGRRGYVGCVVGGSVWRRRGADDPSTSVSML
jgi:hypothetical protein